MKECLSCQFENKDEAKFCAKCGTSFDSERSINTNNNDKHNIKPKRSVFRQKWFWVTAFTVGVLFGLSQMGVIGPDKTTYLVASDSQLIFKKPGGKYTINIDTDGRRWKVSHHPNWCSIDKLDSGFEIDCDKNDSSIDREDWITVVSGDFNLQIRLAQHGQATYVKLSEEILQIGRLGGRESISVDTDGDEWEVKYPRFCSVELEDESFDISFPENNDYGRQGYIYVVSGEESASISYYQDGKCPSCQGSGYSTCYMCSGTGKVWSGVDWYGNFTYRECTYCNGDGRTSCSACGGSGSK